MKKEELSNMYVLRDGDLLPEQVAMCRQDYRKKFLLKLK